MASSMHSSRHSLSVVTNSCVSLPRNPRTKLAATFQERRLLDEENTRKSWEWRNNGENGDSLANDDETGFQVQQGSGKCKPSNNMPCPYSGSVTIHDNSNINLQSEDRANCSDRWDEYESELIASFEDDKDNISSDEFFNKLQKARKSHRENLQVLEEAYNEKLKATNGGTVRRHKVGGFQHKSTTQTGPRVGDHHILHHINDELEEMATSQPVWSALAKTNLPDDNVRDMSSHKPPLGRFNAWQKGSSSVTDSARSSVAFNNDWSDVTWMSDSDAEVPPQIYQRSKISRKHSANSTLSLSKQPDSAAVILDNMWENFSVDGYAPRTLTGSRVSSRSSTKMAKKTESWSPKITIPKPFQMTVRDAEKEKKMSRASIAIDMEIKRKTMEEEVECQKQFKATPVPATTFIPLYEDLQERQMEKSREIQLQSKQKLKEIQKPFSFIKRDERKKLNKQSSTPPPKQSMTPKFKARKVPKYVFDPSVEERILEEEEYRKIRIKMRAEEMLRSSALPPNMEGNAKQYTDGRQRRKLMKKRAKHAFMTDEHKFHPQVNGEIPDYEHLYRKFQEEARQKKQEKEPTVVEPFNLRTSRIPSKRDKILDELQAEENVRKAKLQGLHMKVLRSSWSLNTSEDVLPIKTTSSTVLRKSVTDRALLDRAETEKQQEKQEIMKKLKQKKLQQAVAKKAKAQDGSLSLESTSKEKLKQFREAEISRQKEYERELQDMMERIESRPLLFERESQHNAQKRAERQYIDALRSAGLDERFLERKGRQASRGGAGSKEPTTLNNDSESDEDLDILQGTSDAHDTFEVDQQSNGTFSSEDDNSSTA